MTPALALAALVLAAPLKLAMLPLSAGAGVEPKTADSLAEAAVAEMRRLPGIQIVTRDEIAGLLSLEQQKQMFGCGSDSCAAEIGGLLGVDRLVGGSVSRLGESWLLHLKLVDVKKAATVAQADRRLRGGTIDDVLDALPGIVGELFGNGTATADTTPKPAPTPAAKPSPHLQDKPLVLGDVAKNLEVVTDGKGRFLAFKRNGGLDGPLLYGDEKMLAAQRIVGGGSEGGGDVAFDFTFWDPRVVERWRSSFDFRKGEYTLFCGDKKIPFKPVTGKHARKLLAKAKLVEPRWTRRARALARDDEGTYYFVDEARESGSGPDFNVWMGNRGKVQPLEFVDVISDSAGDIFITRAGKLRFSRDGKAEWATTGRTVKLVPLEVVDNAVMIYTTLGAYDRKKLGTPCDDFL